MDVDIINPKPKSRFINTKTIVAFIIGVAITLLVIFGIYAINNAQQNAAQSIDYETILDLSEFIDEVDSSWMITSADPSVSEIRQASDVGFGDNTLVVHFHKTGANDFSFTGPAGESYTFTISIDKDNNISIFKR